MKLTSIKFLNFRKFREETINLTWNFNTIFWLNWSWKTSVTDAIWYALFWSRWNDFTRVSAKWDLVSYFARDIDWNSDFPSKIELNLEINWEWYRIVRVINKWLKKYENDFIQEKEDSIFWPNLELVWPGEVTNYIEKNLLWVDREIFLRSVFAKQKDLLVLSWNASDRKRLINSILWIDMIENLVSVVSDEAKDKKRELKIKKWDLDNFSIDETEKSKKELESQKKEEEKKQKEISDTIKNMSVSFEKIKSEFKLLQEKKDNITKISNNISLIKQKQEKQKNDKSENTSKLVSLVEKEEYFLKNTWIFDTEKNLLQEFSQMQKQEVLFARKMSLEKEISINKDSLREIEEKLKTSPLTPLLSWEGNFDRSNVLGNYFESPNYIKDLAKELRQNETQFEDSLWNILRNRKFNWYKFRRQHPFGRYICDFYSSELNLVIELDWKIHENQKEYDKIRDEIIKTYWVKILRIKNEEFNDLEKLLLKLIEFISPLQKGEGQGVRFYLIESSFESKQKTLQEEVNTLSQNLWTFSSDLLRIKKERDEIKAEKENIASLWENADCPTCKRKLESQYSFLLNSFELLLEEKRKKWKEISEEKQKNDNNLLVKKEEILKLEKEISDFKQNKEKFSKLQSEQAKFEENLSKLNEEFVSLKDVVFDINSFVKLQNDLNEISKKSNELKRLEWEIKLIPEIKSKLENLEIEEKSLEKSLLVEQENLSKIDFKQDEFDEKKKLYDEFYEWFNKKQQELTEINKLIFEFDKKIQIFINQIENYNQTLKSTEVLVENLAYLEVKKQVLKDYSIYLFSYLKPRLEDIASEYFSTMTDFKYTQISIDDDYNIKIDWKIIDLYSGWEQDLANLCLRLALWQNIWLTNTKNHINFLVLDEVLGSQDFIRQNNILIGLKKLEHKFSQIIMISHLEWVKDFSTKLIEVKSIDKDESIIVEY